MQGKAHLEDRQQLCKEAACRISLELPTSGSREHRYPALSRGHNQTDLVVEQFYDGVK